MNHRINITKSRSGHYTLTIRNAAGERVHHQTKLNSLETAKRLGFQFMDGVNAQQQQQQPVKTHQPANHFFASSVATWMVTSPDRSLQQLLKAMDAEGYPYNLFLVPGAHDADYEIRSYRPMVDGTQWAGFFEPKANRR